MEVAFIVGNYNKINYVMNSTCIIDAILGFVSGTQYFNYSETVTTIT